MEFSLSNSMHYLQPITLKNIHDVYAFRIAKSRIKLYYFELSRLGNKKTSIQHSGKLSFVLT